MSVCQLLRNRDSSLALPHSGAWQEGLDIPMQAASCKHIRRVIIKGDNSLSLPLEGITAKIFSSIEQARPYWEGLGSIPNHFLRVDYLKAIEQAPPKGVSPFYIVFLKEDQTAAIAYLQLIDFHPEDSLEWPVAEGFFAKLIQGFRKGVARVLRLRLLHLGNILLTGPHGFSFSPEIINEEEIQAALAAALPAIRKYLNGINGRSVNGYVVKDLPAEMVDSKTWKENGFNSFQFLPNMTFQIREQWNSFEDYLGGLQSKYRVRARRAFRMLNGLEVRELTRDDIRFRENELFQLYREVAGSASFNMTELQPEQFDALKAELGDAYHLTGYFKDGKLVGFFSTIENGEELEAHFVGFDQAINRKHQLYLNMLYQMIRHGINHGVKRISFARTAMEIKSSVGAVPEQYNSYIRHHSPLVNLLVPALIKLLWSGEEWKPRSPFKESL